MFLLKGYRHPQITLRNLNYNFCKKNIIFQIYTYYLKARCFPAFCLKRGTGDFVSPSLLFSFLSFLQFLFTPFFSFSYSCSFPPYIFFFCLLSLFLILPLTLFFFPFPSLSLLRHLFFFSVTTVL